MSPRYPDDVRRIQVVAMARGVLLDENQAESAWDRYSDSMAAGWMGLPDDDNDLWSTVSFHLTEDGPVARLEDDPDHTPRYPEDVQRIQMVALSHGVVLSARDAEAAWDSYSDDMAAGWMGLPEDDDDLWSYVRTRIPM
jgi:hypothetical protein